MGRPKKPCEKHPGVERTNNRQCPECKRETTAAWQKANPDRVAAKSKRWRDANVEKARAARKAWEVRNPLSNRHRVAVRRARIVGAGGRVSGGLFERLMAEQGGRCRYCHVDLTVARPNMDHIMPLALGGAHDDSNIQLLCETCNRQKKSKHPQQFMREKGIAALTG